MRGWRRPAPAGAGGRAVQAYFGGAWCGWSAWHSAAQRGTRRVHRHTATHRLCRDGTRRGFNDEYLAICAHYGLEPRVINVARPQENGNCESAHGHLKRRIKQHLLLRGSRDFASVEDYDRFLIGVLEAARNGQFNLGLFHVVGPSIASLDEIGEIARYMSGVQYVLTRNFINETNFFEWDEATHKKYFAQISKAHEINIPKLNEMAYEQVDLAGVTFKDFVDNKAADGTPGKFSFVLRGYVKKWCNEIDEEYARVALVQELLSGRTANPRS